MSRAKTAAKAGKTSKGGQRINICENRRAARELDIETTLEAGIVLVGTEVKAMRDGNAHLNEAYVQVVARQATLIGGHIGEYSHGNQFNHVPARSRRLLMHRLEIDRLAEGLQRAGYTALPLALYFNEEGRVKLKIGIGRGKNVRDKRRDIVQREAAREMERTLRERNRHSR